MQKSCAGSLLLALAATAVFIGCHGSASSGPADDIASTQQRLLGPGLGNLTYQPNELYTMVSPIVTDVAPLGHLSFVAMAQGYLVTPYIDGGTFNGNLAVWDVSNPRAAYRVKDYRQPPGTKLREAHAFGFTTGYNGKLYVFAQSNTGFQIWDWTDPFNIFLVKDVVLPGADPLKVNYVGVWWVHLQAPYVYAAGTDKGLYVVDATDPTNPQLVKTMTNTQLGITSVNQVHVTGNLMIVNYANGPGSAILDISDPANPDLKSTDLNNPPAPYATMFNGGKFASAGKTNKKLSVYKVDFDANKNPTGMSRYGVDTGTSDLVGGGYVSFQDGFIIAGFSGSMVKFDARTLPITQIGQAIPPAPYNADVDFTIPLGNLVFASNDDGGGGSLIVHQTAPDTTGPSVNFVSPLDGAINRNVKSRVGLTFTDNVDINSVNSSTVIVRPWGGAALPGKYSVQTGVVNFSPDAPLNANTTYEVVIPAGGVRDDVGNVAPTTFSSSFSTGNTIGGGAGGCNVGADTPGLVGSAIAFSVTGCTGSAPLSYAWVFGDDSPAGTGASTSHTYAAPRHYSVILTVTDAQGVAVTLNRRQTVTYPATASKPTRSSTIVVDSTRGRVSLVNSDANTAASIDAASPFTKRWEVPVGKNPRTLAQPAPGGNLWVVNQDDASVSVLDGGTGAGIATIALPASSRPYGIAFNPAGTLAYVTLEATGRLLRIDASTRAITGDADVGPRPRGVAVSSDGARILVTRLVSPDGGGEVREVSAASFGVTRTFVLPEDTTTPSTEGEGPGLPNYVQAVTITPDGRGAWVPSKKDNIRRGTGPGSDGQLFTHDSRLRTIVSKLDLVANTTDLANRRDIDNADMANAVVFTDLGDWAFVSTQGGNRVEAYDALSHAGLTTITETGLAPRGVAFFAGKLYVQNFMSRDVAVYDVSSIGGTNSLNKLGAVSTQASEALTPQVLQGKKIFYNAGDLRMSRDSYSSCASCHLDGDNDGRRWDFTQFGEGVRATASLLGRGGVGEGPVHWTGNFDEIQDFENDIRGPAFGGTGFLSDADFGITSDALGVPKAGRNADLDALSAYVSSLALVPPSPFRNADGTMTAAALAGKTLFESPAVGCAVCHSGAEKTDSALNVFHDVGTLTAASGQRRGQPLTGLDTPTLLGVWATAPYLHDNSAATLLDVITTRNPANQHGTTSQLNATEQAQLVAYLQQLDDGVPQPSWTGQDVGAVGLAGSFTDVGGSVTVSGAGADITGTADAFTFVWKDLVGDGSITARVASLSGGDANNVKAGVMMRDPGADGLGANDVNGFTMIKPNGTQNKFQKRLTSGATTVSVGAIASPNTWLRLTRAGNTITSAHSADGVTWVTLGSDSTFALPGTLKAGFAVTSHIVTALATATFTNITVTQAGPPPVANPTFSPPGGTSNNPPGVSLASATPSASFRYTLDGSDPTSTTGTLYTGPITVSTTGTVIKAIAYKAGMADSAVQSATYVLTAATPTSSPAAGTYSTAQSVSLSSATLSAAMFYTLDGSTPTTSSTPYTGPIAIAVTTTLKAIATKSGMNVSGVLVATYTISAGTSVTVKTDQDAHVRDGTTAQGQNYGVNPTLEVKNYTTVGNTRWACVRFPLGTVPASVTAAKVRLFGNSTATTKAIGIYAVSNITWTEGTGTVAAPTTTGITWTNKPAPGAKQGGDVNVTVTAGWWEWDVAAYVQAEKTAGHTHVTFAIKMETVSNDSPTVFHADENTSGNDPELKVN